MIRASMRRPVAVAMTYMSVALLGVAAWRNIPLELLPDTELPRLSVSGRWRGASPETVEAFLTSPIEAAVQQVRGVETVTSESYEESGAGTARIDVEFARGTDMNFARLELSERLTSLEEQLPASARPLTIDRYVPEEFAEQRQPFLRYTITGPHTLEALRAHVDDVIAPEVAEVEGVAIVRASGGRARVLEIELDEAKINALGLGPALVYQRINDLDLVREAGAVRLGAFQRTVTIRNQARSVADVRTAVITSRNGRLIRLEDVATVRDTYEEPTRYYRIDGRPAVAFDVLREIGTNTVRVADQVKARLAQLAASHPPGVRLILDRDESELIRRQLSDLRFRALVAIAVIFVVLLAFLRSFRSAGVIFATIVFSVLIGLNLVYFGGFTLNVLTLMGLAMGFGLIVDNSIVVWENVYRRWQQGDSPTEAAVAGAAEVVLAVLAATATTLIVFIPFVYLQGELRVYYVPLAISVGLTLLASLFVAFTFIPALAARILPARAVGPVVAGGSGEARGRMDRRDGGDANGSSRSDAGAGARAPWYVRAYSALIGFTLRHPWLTITVTALCFAGSYRLFDRYVTRGVIWRGFRTEQTYIDIQITFPRGAGLERTDEMVRYFETKLAQLPEVERFVTNVTDVFGRIQVTFPDSLELTAVPVVIKEQMVAHSYQFGGADVRVYGYGPSFYGGGGSAPNYRIQVLGYNYEEARRIAEDLGRRLTRFSRVREVNTNAAARFFERNRAMQYAVEIDREALGRHDLAVDDITRRLASAIRGEIVRSSLRLGGDELRYDVKVSGYRDMDVERLQSLPVATESGSAVRIGDVTRIREQEVLARIRRENQQYERTVAYEFRGPARLGDVVRDAVIEATALPPGYTIEATRGFQFRTEEQRQMYAVLALSLLLIYMVTAALFESLRQPFCVLLTVPMALIGVFLIFFYANASFTREAYIGVIMMGGIVVNNAILLVDRINRVRREAGSALRDAIVRGTVERVRPILMTTATTVLGLLPLVLFSETADANIWNALGYALIGGLLSSTLFVLTTTPALYLLLERGRSFR